jgi:hypothetical protein
MEKTRNAHKTLFGSPKGRDPSEDLGAVGKIILERILGKQSGKVWTGFIWLRTGTGGVLF